ncbi:MULTISPECIES: class I adenylate-forming enzyme family protein [unclassified Haematobacter]|uniref:class I adenylate-forming enzyme family protein n=1 Tax=unclassified Haematobacter TaxID=2640585 RepID=UPI0025BF3AAC|nr:MULTISPECIES: AMP-binding protein [unclassified Haematobacter]
MSWDRGLFPPMRHEWHYGSRVVECFTDRPRNLYDLLAEAVTRDPDGEALVVGDQRLSWTALSQQVDRTARALSAQGLARGDRAVMVMGNHPRFIVTLFALFRLGVIAVPVSIRSSVPEVAYVIANTTARLVVHDADLAHLLPQGATAMAYEALQGDGPLPADLPGEEEVALILHTSGTTGKPKGAMLTHMSLIHSAMFYEATFGLKPGDRAVIAVPFNHVTGIAGLISVSFRAGATLICMEGFKAKAFLDLAEAERMTYTIMVPAMYNLCLLQPDFATRDLKSWRMAAYGGAPMPEPTIRRLAAAIPGIAFANCYGATESIVAQLITPPDRAIDKRGTVGCPLPGTRAMIMDDEGREQPTGMPGEIWLSGPNVTLGYWNNPEATAAAFPSGFWRSGDIGVADEEGFVSVLDRAKDMINRGGLKIYSAELENVLTDHPAVVEAAAVPRACPVLGERVHAVLMLRTGATEAEILAWCQERLSDYKVPETLEMSPDPLPRNANGKIDKKVLRARLDAV